MLKEEFVPVAIDQAYQRRQKDAEGEFYRKLAGQGPRGDLRGTTQGLYIGTAGGKLLVYNNNRGPDRIRRFMRQALASYKSEDVKPIEQDKPDPRYNPLPPEGGLVVRVNAKVLGGYEETNDKWQQIFQTAISRDNLWISRAEHQQLAKGRLSESLKRRIVRYHLVDNTRGEPPFWKEEEIRKLEMSLEDGQLQGSVHLETADGKRGYQAELLGHVKVDGGKVTRLDVVVKGDFWGHGRYTGGCPTGKFPLAVAFRLADGQQTADRIPPQGSRGWVRGYIQ